jgi:hypothetical protein
MQENLSELCAPGTKYSTEYIKINDNVSLKLRTFIPAKKTTNAPILFVPGWISLIVGWKNVLKEITKDFVVYYIETREKISSRITGEIEYGVEEIGDDIINIISFLKLEDNNYILLGSSLGATAILESCHLFEKKSTCLVLVGPNAIFRVPKLGMGLIYIFPPPLYLFMKPIVKWYLRNFQLGCEKRSGAISKILQCFGCG